MHEEAWQSLAAAHAVRVGRWVGPRLARRARGEAHPIEDFLFEYYPFSPAKLAVWHPGHGVVLEGAGARRYLAHPAYHELANGITTSASWLEGKHARLETALSILTSTEARSAVTGCFALHEWAMVYGLGQSEVRHANLPLRVSPAAISDTVESVGLRCTHLDAYRFFTSSAVPRNSLVPTRATQAQHEQPGCLHAAMDLYKYAFWFSPLVSSDLIADCFENAMHAREIDMRASPYDVTGFGLEPIRVETPEGRREYAEHQRSLIETTAPLRSRLMSTLGALILTSHPCGCASSVGQHEERVTATCKDSG